MNTTPPSRLCLFVCSSDNTHDVFTALSGRLIDTWPVRDMAAFVGTNTAAVPEPLKAVRAPVSGWRTELLHQVKALPTDVEHIVLLLDDFFFHAPVSHGKLAELSAFLDAQQGDYLRLRPVERALLPSLLRRALKALGALPAIERLRPSEPYYSSLQVAIWRRDYLLRCLGEPGSIWDFEHASPPGSRHFAITSACLDYDHLVEKGRWYRVAPSLLNLAATSPVFQRGFETDPLKNAKRYNRLKFMLLGYAVFRARRFLSARSKP